MAWTDSCKLDFTKQVEHRKSQGISVKDALEVLSEESGISKGTLKNWLYPESQVQAKKKRNKQRKSSKITTRQTSDVERFSSDLAGFIAWNKATGECLKFASDILRKKVVWNTEEEEEVVVKKCFRLIDKFFKLHKMKNERDYELF